MKIERLGAWYALDKLSGSQIPPLLTLLERLNYDVLWYPESRGYESLSLASFLLGNSTKLKIGSSIASIYARDAFAARRGMLSLNSLYRIGLYSGWASAMRRWFRASVATPMPSRLPRCALIWRV
jgi:alkanesulfonate monooxygenase SsuD/methylene tetrahydromethanopterin reductase-like flavin-dependent oxidoreductase (luciferase family)